MPFNPITGTVYVGENGEMLEAAGFKDPRWVTLNQANKLGGFATCPIAGKPSTKFEKNSGIPHYSGVPASEQSKGRLVKFMLPVEKNGETKFMRRSTVLYNIEQCYGVKVIPTTREFLQAAA